MGMVNDAFFENQKNYHELKDSVIGSDSGLKKLYADLDRHRQELEELATSEGEFLKMLGDMETQNKENTLAERYSGTGLSMQTRQVLDSPSFLHRALHWLFGKSKGQSIGTQTGNRIVSQNPHHLTSSIENDKKANEALDRMFEKLESAPTMPEPPEPRRMKY